MMSFLHSKNKQGGLASLLLLFGLFSGLAGSNQAMAQGIDFGDRIAAYFPFNGNAQDMTMQGNDGLVNGAKLITDRFGQANAAYSFDGVNNSIRIPYGEELDFTAADAFSMSVWIKPRDINPGCVMLRNFDYGLKWNSMESALTFYAGLQGGYPNSSRKRWRSDQWYHLVIVQQPKKLMVYINGEVDASLPKPHKTSPSKDDLYLGKHPYYWGAYTGAIDDLILYKRALNEYEIQALYQIQTMPLEVAVQETGPPLEMKQVLGVWQGILTQPAGESVTNFAFWLDIQANGSKIKGASRIEVESSQAYGVAVIDGGISGDKLNFSELRLSGQKNFQGFEWCKKFGRLRYNPEEGSLIGEWYADNCQKGGKIILYKSRRPFNYYDNRLSEFVSKEELLERLKAGEQLEQQPNQVVKLEVENIVFQTNSAKLSEGSRAYLLREIAPLLNENPQISIHLTGHTDSAGDETYNLNLSALRAESVMNTLIQAGIVANRLSSEGFGETRPIADNATPAGRKTNRRVEFEARVK